MPTGLGSGPRPEIYVCEVGIRRAISVQLALYANRRWHSLEEATLIYIAPT